MKNLKNCLLFFFVIITGFVYGQTGSIKGNVTDENKEPVIGGTVMIVEKTSLGAVTDIDGNYIIKNVPPGTYTLKLMYSGYQDKLVKNVKVFENVTTDQDITYDTLDYDTTMVSQIVLYGKRDTEAEESVLKEKQESEQIVETYGGSQASKGQDRDVAQVLQRVPGITIVDNRFVMVRGLNQRYNVVMLNGIIAPSTESDSRTFSFDLIPTQMLDRLMIYKSGGAELPGDMAGAVIKVYTKNTSDENYHLLGFSLSYRTSTTLQSHYWNKGGKTDFLGFDNGKRALPSDFPAHLNNVDYNGPAQERAAKSLQNNWAIDKKNLMPDIRINYAISQKFEVGKFKFNNITSVNYANTWQFLNITNQRHQTLFDTARQSYTRLYKYHDEKLNNNIRLGVLHNWSVRAGEKTTFQFRNMYTQMGFSETTVREGQDFRTSTNGYDVRSRALYYQSRGIYSGQLEGKHLLKSGRTEITGIVGYSHIRSQEPDFRRAGYLRESGSDQPFKVYIPSVATDVDAARFFSDLKEHTVSGTAFVEHQVTKKEEEKDNIKIRGGIYVEKRARAFSSRWMSFVRANTTYFDYDLVDLPLETIFSQQNINSKTGFILNEQTDASNKYSASNFLTAGYAGTTIPYKKFILATGLRLEHNVQELTGTRQGAVTPTIVKNPITSLLPFINLSYNLTKTAQLRGSYSRTINRPEFREIAPFGFYLFDVSSAFVGNPDLKIANINNFDLRWEWYPSVGETVSFGVFYKSFINPIELYVLPVGSFDPKFTFGNAKNATNYGLETEIRKSFYNFSDKKFFQNLSFVANASLIKSNVNLGNTTAGQASSRPLQGQSPYVVNAGFYYNDETTKFMVSALYNVYGKRIFGVGDAQFATLYEMPRQVLDLTITKGLGKRLELRAGVQDLLNQKWRLMEDNNQNFKIDGFDQESISQKRGSYYTVGIGMKF